MQEDFINRPDFEKLLLGIWIWNRKKEASLDTDRSETTLATRRVHILLQLIMQTKNTTFSLPDLKFCQLLNWHLYTKTSTSIDRANWIKHFYLEVLLSVFLFFNRQFCTQRLPEALNVFNIFSNNPVFSKFQ